ncbi:hypothetical protein Tco_1148896, partial [Tanacetum coccineum]
NGMKNEELEGGLSGTKTVRAGSIRVETQGLAAEIEVTEPKLSIVLMNFQSKYRHVSMNV